MPDKMKFILKLLIIILLNVCVLAITGHSRGIIKDVPVMTDTVPGRIRQEPQSRSNLAGVDASSDYNLLARLISAETRGEPYSVQVAVGAVILNRVGHAAFPDSIAGVAYQPGAFDSVTDGSLDGPIAESAYRAAKEALNGSDPSGGALYYYDPAKSASEWLRSRVAIKTIGGLVFCK